MRYSFKNEVSHLEKINSLSKEVLINSRFLRNNSMKDIHNNNKIELMKKCYSNYINPKFKENYFDIITGVLPNNVNYSYSKDNFIKKIYSDNLLLKNLNKNEKIEVKKAILLNMIKIKNPKIEKKGLFKSYSTKQIDQNKELSFNFNKNSFLNRFENLKNKMSNLSDQNLLYNRKHSNSKINYKTKNKNCSYEDSFFSLSNNSKGKFSEQKIKEGGLKLKQKLNLFKL
jgi:hypothetical protein